MSIDEVTYTNCRTVYGTVLSGSVKVGDKLNVMHNNHVELKNCCISICLNDQRLVPEAHAGDKIAMGLLQGSGYEIKPGMFLTSQD